METATTTTVSKKPHKSIHIQIGMKPKKKANNTSKLLYTTVLYTRHCTGIAGALYHNDHTSEQWTGLWSYVACAGLRFFIIAFPACFSCSPSSPLFVSLIAMILLFFTSLDDSTCFPLSIGFFCFSIDLTFSALLRLAFSAVYSLF